MSWADLHLHSRWSDGEWTVKKLVRAARRAKLGGLAVTDHDDVRSFAEARLEAAEVGLSVISGVEISAWRAGMDIHILGYGFDPEDPGLTALLREARDARVVRAERIVARLEVLGIPLTLQEVKRVAGDAAIGRPHVARALVEAGFVPSIREAFDRYLADGKPACVDKLRVTPAQAIRALHDAGGVAVCAHPQAIGGLPGMNGLVEEGLDGVEVRHPLHGSAAEAALDAFCAEHDLVRTGGSDFHGPRPACAEPGGTAIPREWWEALRERIDRNRAASGRSSLAAGGG